ncbi:outer membrane protein assembly factor BamD [Pseudaquabacterium pictum]|uniref:Outer membrane protein assembly factor BamD n=1 Tax=Pseudaquabacterium pictum TaxID=2315236 RepID=A0A480AZA1_9BURK|nr:outer membrane protein assembly factor BamD [Rubrivivax pictus]
MNLFKGMKPPAGGRWRMTGLAATLLALAVLGGCSSTKKDDDRGSVEKLYADAKDDLSSGSYDQAVKQLEKVEGRAAGTLLAQQAMLDLAYAKWRLNERVEAITTLDRFIKLHPSSPALDYALYLKGVVNFNETMGFLSGVSRQDLSERDQQASRDSYQAFEQLVQAFPESKYSDDARARMGYIVNSLAEYELHVARYYYQRQAFVAAANRAQLAVREYPQTPAVEEALYIMAASYDKLGLEQLRVDAERVLTKNFPNTRYIKNGVRVPERAWWQFW